MITSWRAIKSVEHLKNEVYFDSFFSNQKKKIMEMSFFSSTFYRPILPLFFEPKWFTRKKSCKNIPSHHTVKYHFLFLLFRGPRLLGQYATKNVEVYNMLHKLFSPPFQFNNSIYNAMLLYGSLILELSWLYFDVRSSKHANIRRIS